MLSWFERKKYRAVVLEELQTLLPGVAAGTQLLASYPSTGRAIDQAFAEKRSTMELAANLAGSILVNEIEHFDLVTRQEALSDLEAWSSGVGGAAASSGPNNGLTRMLKPAVARVSALRNQQQIGEQIETWFYSEVFGALAGKSETERAQQRTTRLLAELFDPSSGKSSA